MSNQINITTKRQGFTLVELSIVIIIIGFLIAGIAAGTALIKQAEINSVVSDMQQYQTAYNSFILRYNAIPGDQKNAESFFPTSATTTGGGDDYCNGNGNGIIEFDYNSPDETYIAWRTMALAGIISAGIVEIPDDDWDGVPVIGSTVPTSKVTGAGYLMAGADSQLGDEIDSAWDDGVTNAVFIGKVDPLGGLDYDALKPEDAFNMDKKIDDGTVSGSDFTGADTGSFRTIRTSNGGTIGGCLTSGKYNIATSTIACVSGLALN